MEPLSMGIMAASAIASLLASLGGTEPEQVRQFPTLSPNQTGAQDEALKYVMEGLKNGPGKGFDFSPIRNQAETGFYGRTIPGIAQKFAGADALRGSGFMKAMGGAGREFEQGLASQESQYKMQTNRDYMNNLMQMLQLGLQPRFTTGITPEHLNAFGTGMTGLSSVLGNVGGMYEKDAQGTNFLEALKGLNGAGNTQQQDSTTSPTGNGLGSDFMNQIYLMYLSGKLGDSGINLYGNNLKGNPGMNMGANNG